MGRKSESGGVREERGRIRLEVIVRLDAIRKQRNLTAAAAARIRSVDGRCLVKTVTADPDALTRMLTRLKLTAIRDQLDSLLDTATRRKLTLLDTVKLLCEAEVARKDERRIQMASSIAEFPFVRTLDGFEFAAQPSLDAKLIRELATCRWIGNGDALLLLGPPGVGKTHLAVALGREAIQHGYSTLFTSAMALVTALTKAHQVGRLEERLVHYAKPKLLIVDELGYLPLEANAAHLFFQLVSRRYERGSMAGNQQPCGERMGDRVRRHRGGYGDPRSAAAPQPRHHDPRRQLSTTRETALRTHAATFAREGVGEVDLNQGVNSKCRQGVKTWVVVEFQPMRRYTTRPSRALA